MLSIVPIILFGISLALCIVLFLRMNQIKERKEKLPLIILFSFTLLSFLVLLYSALFH